MDIYRSCSRHFTFEMLFHCGETWQRIQCPNLPEQNDSWLAYRELATHILDPLVYMFGPPSLTYGFCGAVLRKTILANPSPGIAPTLDQHAACELNKQGRLVCPRQGAAIDLIYPRKNSYQIALWLAQHTPFDRLYLYGPKQSRRHSRPPKRCSIRLPTFPSSTRPASWPINSYPTACSIPTIHCCCTNALLRNYRRCCVSTWGRLANSMVT